jgi:hypothetical protein
VAPVPAKYVFAGQSTHALAGSLAPRYLPSAQATQAALPALVLYVPATHGVHGPPSGPVYPALQGGLLHAALDVLATGELCPTGHAVQAPFKFELLYVPGAQAVQDDQLPPYPAMQEQPLMSLQRVLMFVGGPHTDPEFAGQEVQGPPSLPYVAKLHRQYVIDLHKPPVPHAAPVPAGHAVHGAYPSEL